MYTQNHWNSDPNIGVQSLGISSFCQNSVGFNYSNAYWLSKFSELEYRHLSLVDAQLEQFGFTTRKYFSSKVDSKNAAVKESYDITFGTGEDTQAFYAANEKFAIISVRGTEMDERADILTDANGLTQSYFTGMVHGGFYAATQGVANWMATIIQQSSTRIPVFLTGHSLGGAIVQLLAFDMIIRSGGESSLQKPFVHHVYSFGAPRVGDASFVKKGNSVLKAAGASQFLIMNEADPVTRTPLESFGFRYYGSTFIIEGSGTLRFNQKPNDSTFPRFDAHRINSYQTSIIRMRSSLKSQITQSFNCGEERELPALEE